MCAELRRLRQRAGLSQSALAEQAGLSTEAISLLERGLRAPRRSTLRRLADALSLDGGERQALFSVMTARVPNAHLLPDFPEATIGRATEISQVARLLSSRRARLVTLTGPGGIGKTRVAVAAAASVGVDQTTRVRWLGVSHATTAEGLWSELATALGFTPAPGLTRDGLAAAAGESDTLLVIDHAESLLDEVGALCSTLLAQTSRLRLVVTSKQRLAVPGEVTMVIRPLSLPNLPLRTPVGLDATTAVEASPACRLFLARASGPVLPPQQPRPVSEDEARAVSAICRQVDGVPLAIEHAASRASVMSVGELATTLQRSLRVLDRPPTGGGPGLRQVMATDSFASLTAAEQTMLLRVSLFSSSFTSEAVARVCATESITAVDTLARLVAKSLVLRGDDVGGRATFRLLRVVREFAADELDRRSDAEEARMRFASHILGLATEAADQLTGPDQGAWAARLDAEADNLRSAFDWLVVADPESALLLVGSLWRWWHLRGLYQQGRVWAVTALNRTPDARPQLRAPALAVAGSLGLLQCDYEAAQTQIQEALDAYSLIGDNSGVAWSLALLGAEARERGEYTVAAQLHERARVLAERGQDQHAVASQLNALAEVAWLRGDFAHAEILGQRALEIMSDLADPQGVAWALLSLGVTARYRGDAREAQALLNSSLELSESIDYREGIACALLELGAISRLRGDLVAARRRLTASLVEHRRLGNRWRLASVLDELAAVAAASGDLRQARAKLGTADQLRGEIGVPVALAEQSAREQTVQATQVPVSRSFAGGQLAGIGQRRG